VGSAPATDCTPRHLVPTVLRAGIAAVLPGESLLRTGHLLAVSSLVNAGLGSVFWLFATHWYDEEIVGLSYTVLSASLLLSVAIDVARARRRLRWAVALQVAMCVLVLGLTHVLLPRMGVTGAGVAWLATQCLIAVPLLVFQRRWLVPVTERSS
jgi:O-antigen/teichoic acid export membrane protein